MESLTKSVRGALFDPNLAPVWFRQLSHNNIFTGTHFRVTLHQVLRYADGVSVYHPTEAYDLPTLQAAIRSIGQKSAERKPIASLQMLKIHSVTPDQFLSLLAEYDISDTALLAMNSGTFHFQVFKHPPVEGVKPNRICLGLAYNVATIMWRYDSKTHPTLDRKPTAPKSIHVPKPLVSIRSRP